MVSRSLRSGCLLLAGLYCLFIPSPCVSAPAGTADLKSLFESRRWFELRDSVVGRSTPRFYQGVVACAFNKIPRCEKELEAVIRFRPRSNDAVHALRRLASVYLSHGRYREALTQVNAVLAVKPDDSDALDVRPLLAVLSEYPDQSLRRRRSTTLHLQEGGLAFSIHGVTGTYWFDTGANFSILSESEAKRFGLRVRPVAAKANVSTGAKVNFRIAVADHVSFGPILLKNVAFLVFPDDQPPFKDAPVGSRGLIGIPVLLAFERFVWGADKTFEIVSKPVSADTHRPSLCFDGNTPVTQLQFENQNLTFVLDTGATNTDLFPPFAAAFPELIRGARKTDSYKMEGVGSSKEMNAAIVDSVRLVVGGYPVVLKPANVLLTPTGEASKFFQGNLGIDLLQQAHKVIFDFKAMTLSLR
jgi:predicted aspartyl protease